MKSSLNEKSKLDLVLNKLIQDHSRSKIQEKLRKWLVRTNGLHRDHPKRKTCLTPPASGLKTDPNSYSNPNPGSGKKISSDSSHNFRVERFQPEAQTCTKSKIRKYHLILLHAKERMFVPQVIHTPLRGKNLYKREKTISMKT